MRSAVVVLGRIWSISIWRRWSRTTPNEKNDGKGVNGTGTYPFTNDCHRIENGAPTTNVPRPADEPPGTINAFAMDCLVQFKLGYLLRGSEHSPSP
jgi:hypothetical protein